MQRTLLALALTLSALPALAADEVVIVSGRSRTFTVPFRFAEGMNSNPAAVEAHVDLKSRQITFFGKKVGVATYTVFDARDRRHTLELDLRVVSQDLAPLEREIDETSAKNDLARHQESVWIDRGAATELLADHATPHGLAVGRAVARELSSVEGITIHVTGDRVKVEGEVASQADLDRVSQVLSRFGEL